LNLTLHADYSLRVLLYLAEHTDRPVSTREISEAYGISRNHLVRVVQTLQTHAFVKASAGRDGGIILAKAPSSINLGEVVRKTEPNFRLVECFDLSSNTCRIVPICGLRGVLGEALDSFFEVLNRYSLADVARLPPGQRLSDFLPLRTLSA
jgi:Rrf2 family transcriptional regulator, nitric oxide-sensitive transcriptional repressor